MAGGLPEHERYVDELRKVKGLEALEPLQILGREEIERTFDRDELLVQAHEDIDRRQHQRVRLDRCDRAESQMNGCLFGQFSSVKVEDNPYKWVNVNGNCSSWTDLSTFGSSR